MVFPPVLILVDERFYTDPHTLVKKSGRENDEKAIERPWNYKQVLTGNNVRQQIELTGEFPS